MIPSINLMRKQADVMVRSALSGSATFDRNAIEFFQSANFNKTKNGLGLQGNGLNAYYSAVNSAEGTAIAVNSRGIINVKPFLQNLLEKRSQQNPQLKAELDTFITELNKNYKNNLGARISLLSNGVVNTEERYPASSKTFGQIFSAKINNILLKIERYIENIDE